MADLEGKIAEAIAERAEGKATVDELRDLLAERGVDASGADVEAACNELVRAGELQVVGERGDSTLYAVEQGRHPAEWDLG